jgi:DNA-binding IclR family transcriptional regulator
MKKTQTKQKNEKYIVPAVEQASKLLFCLAENSSQHMSLIDICTQIGIHKSKAYSILQTLQKFGLIQRNIQGKGYSLGPGLITLSRKVLDNFDIARLAEPMLKKLAMKAGGTATLGLIVGEKVFVVSKQEGEAEIGVTIRVGHTFPLTYGSHGKAIAAFLPEKELDVLLKKSNLFFHGKPEKLNKEILNMEIEQCRKNGFALDLGEMKQGLNTTASAVIGVNGVPIGYIALIGFFSAETARKYGPMVAETGRTLSEKLGAKVKSQQV